MSVTALIVAAGAGQRLGGGIPKQFRPIAGKPLLRWAVEGLGRHPSVGAVRVVVGGGQQPLAAEALAGLEVGELIVGGERRSDSVRAGLASIAGEAVLVHDAARPFCPPPVVDRLLAALEFFEGAAPVLAVGDTLARADAELNEPVDRDGVVRIQTPQAFRLAELIRAYGQWSAPAPTDETIVLRRAGMRVAAVAGDPMLDKLTTAADWEMAQCRLAGLMVPRTGMGFDVHAFGGEGPLMLGGVAIPGERGLAGHSDADVALHAITDALLGAAGLGDLGEHFPPTDRQWEGASSDLFLGHAAGLARGRGAIIDHVDCTIICERPRIAPHRAAMRGRIAAILDLPPQSVSVKATTTETLGFTGRGEGIAAQAVVSIRLELSG